MNYKPLEHFLKEHGDKFTENQLNFIKYSYAKMKEMENFDSSQLLELLDKYPKKENSDDEIYTWNLQRKEDEKE
jgi:parvulin-like peptidyl-prolyl isomerase